MHIQRVLMVDDDANIRTVAGIALECVGNMTVMVVDSGQKALDAVDEFRPDVILLDVMMPGMDGPTTFKELRKIKDYEEIPVIFMTAKVMTEEGAAYEALGAAAVISKPFDPLTLAQEVQDKASRWSRRLCAV